MKNFSYKTFLIIQLILAFVWVPVVSFVYSGILAAFFEMENYIHEWKMVWNDKID